MANLNSLTLKLNYKKRVEEQDKDQNYFHRRDRACWWLGSISPSYLHLPIDTGMDCADSAFEPRSKAVLSEILARKILRCQCPWGAGIAWCRNLTTSTSFHLIVRLPAQNSIRIIASQKTQGKDVSRDAFNSLAQVWAGKQRDWSCSVGSGRDGALDKKCDNWGCIGGITFVQCGYLAMSVVNTAAGMGHVDLPVRRNRLWA